MVGGDVKQYWQFSLWQVNYVCVTWVLLVWEGPSLIISDFMFLYPLEVFDNSSAGGP